MPSNDRDIADTYARSARQAVNKAPRHDSDSLQRATAEALLAIFHQLKHMEDTSITLRGAADLSESMDRLSRSLPDR
jgi:hypothetical protein